MTVRVCRRSGILNVVRFPKLRCHKYSETRRLSVFGYLFLKRYFCSVRMTLLQCIPYVTYYVFMCVCVCDRHMQSRKTGILINI